MKLKVLADALKTISFQNHLILSILIRCLLIVYGEVQDSVSEVPYTDIDYKVVTDGARYVTNDQSPFNRHTYRYTPLLAYLLVPNILLHKCIGKILFSIGDILVAVLIYKVIIDEYTAIFEHNSSAVMNRLRGQKNPFKFRLPDRYVLNAKIGAMIWLYNPLTMVIATRGNGDSLTSLLVLVTLWLLLKPSDSQMQYFVAGLVHGLAIHFRLYPLVFSLSMFMYAGRNNQCIWKINTKQIYLVIGTLFSLVALTTFFYRLYGSQFIYETYIYHLIRKDTRHNFSLYFYMQYLNADQSITVIEKLLTLAPQLFILTLSSLHFGPNRKTLPFSIFIQSFTIVTFNSVLTSQYFVWFLSILPLCWKNFSKLKMRSICSYALLWFLTQAAWLFPAYLLEFKGWNTFNMLWMQGIMFFASNIFIMERLITNFGAVADFRLKEF
ncbi:hypothetical protein HA402_013338 [Bradysia odoriphaga]|nr:hypothetical protein HA402_013338 [Bradysia odoriphaga]